MNCESSCKLAAQIVLLQPLLPSATHSETVYRHGCMRLQLPLKRIFTGYMLNWSKQVYKMTILFAVRTTKSRELDDYTKFLFSLAFEFMREQKKHSPGLLHVYTISSVHAPSVLRKVDQIMKLQYSPGILMKRRKTNVDHLSESVDF